MTTPIGEPRATEPPAAAAVAQDVAAPARVRRGPSLRTFEALRNEHFRLFYMGNLLQFAAMQMQMLVRGQLVFMLTGSFAKLGIMALANAIPGLLMAPIGG